MRRQRNKMNMRSSKSKFKLVLLVKKREDNTHKQEDQKQYLKKNILRLVLTMVLVMPMTNQIACIATMPWMASPDATPAPMPCTGTRSTLTISMNQRCTSNIVYSETTESKILDMSKYAFLGFHHNLLFRNSALIYNINVI